MVFPYSTIILENIIRKSNKFNGEKGYKLIKGFEHYNYICKLQELNVPTLYYRRCDLIQVFRIIKKN